MNAKALALSNYIVRNGFLLMACLVFVQLSATAQKSHQIFGRVADTSGAGIASSTVVLLGVKDSIMMGFNITDKNGSFSIEVKDTGTYVLEVSSLAHQAFKRLVSVSRHGDTELEDIVLKPKLYDLEGVEITESTSPISISGDTVSYQADAFGTESGAMVEDLLKRLPGVEVEEDGTIKSQGEEVRRVLVDGKEFFGGDTKIATKNLPADIVDRVQVYDKQSDIASFTGMDDGNGVKTINLMLKEGRKKGTFGQLQGQYGTQDRFRTKGNLHRFNQKMRLSFVGNANNTNEQAFTVEDYLAMNGGPAALANGSGNIMDINIGAGPDQVENAITSRQGTGINFNYDFSPKTTFSSHYFLYNSEAKVIGESTSSTFLGASGFSSKSQNRQTLMDCSQRLHNRLTYRLNELQEVQLDVNLSTGRQRDSFWSYEDYWVLNQLESTVTRDNGSSGRKGLLESRLRYKKRGSSGRGQFTLLGNASMRNSAAQESIENVNRMVVPDTGFETILIRQNQEAVLNNKSYFVEGGYTRKLTTSSYAVFRSAISSYSTVNQRDYYDLPTGGSRVFNAQLSNRFRQGYLYHTTGMNLVKKWSGIQFSSGLDYQQSTLQGQNLSDGNEVGRTFGFWLPSFRLTGKLNNDTEIRLLGWRDILEPSINQLQPIVANSDPQRLFLGNPTLVPESRYSMAINFRGIKRFNHRYLFARLQGSITRDKIVYASETEGTRQVFTPVNTDFQTSLFSNINYRIYVRPIRLFASIKSFVSYTNGIFYINNASDRARMLRSVTDLELGNKNTKKIEIRGGISVEPNVTRYQINESEDNHFVNMGVVGNVRWKWNHWEFSNRSKHLFFRASRFDKQPGFTLLDFKASYTLKDGKISLDATLVDALNQNTGIDRVSQLNVIGEQVNRVLGRYFLLGFRYKISHFGS